VVDFSFVMTESAGVGLFTGAADQRTSSFVVFAPNEFLAFFWFVGFSSFLKIFCLQFFKQNI
jgi:hypothetical protein